MSVEKKSLTPPRWLWNGGVPVPPPLTVHPRPVWSFHPVPIDLGEARKLGQVSDRYLAAYAKGVREPRLVKSLVLPSSDAKRNPRDLPRLVPPVLPSDGDSLSYLVVYPLRVRLEVESPSKEIRGALLDVNDRVLAAWEGPQDELDVFVGTVSHAFTRSFARILRE